MAADPSQPGAFYHLSFGGEGTQLLYTDLNGTTSVRMESLPGTNAFAACADEEGNYYYTSQDGIYRLVSGGTLAELVVDGAGTMLTGEDTVPMGLALCPDGSFLMITGDSRVYRYYWDADATAEESTPPSPSGAWKTTIRCGRRSKYTSSRIPALP